jgi:hypothetical protein
VWDPMTRYCTNCGEAGTLAFCSNCGGALGEVSPTAKAGAVNTIPQPLISPAQTVKTKSKTGWIFAGAAVVAVAALLIVTFATAESWTKVVVPAEAETFRDEEYLTGAYVVEDTGGSPCWVGQGWNDCINLYIVVYNTACAGVELTNRADVLCSNYSAMIDDMEARDRWGSTVSSLGSWGFLNKYAEKKTRTVSNNDSRPAVTREAVCYLGFIGECE